MSALPVSACVIAFNEEANLRACLEGLRCCAETVVVDSGSTDRTRELAGELGARVLHRDWTGHIDQKNFAIDQAAHDWVLCLDADERLSAPLAAAIARLFQDGEPPRAGYLISRRTFYLGRWLAHTFRPDWKLRLFPRSLGRWGGVNPHDHVQLAPGERPGRLAGDLLHLSFPSLAAQLRTMDYFSDISAREKLARGYRLLPLQLVFGPPAKFLKMYLLKRGFLDGWPGFVAALMGAFYVFLKYAKLFELVRVKGESGGGVVRYGRRGEG